jgi:transposase InsO family protein
MPSTTPTPAAREPTTAFEVPSTEKNDPILKQQSYRFQQLPKWEQQSLIRMHKNLGHPSNDRLVQAAQEIQCQVCAANAPPKHARPATLKTMLDFNHKIYVDGITWTNKTGQTYHLYHILDAGTNYHVAVATPAKTTESFIQMMNQHWLSWAGPPNEMVVDSGTELNSAQVDEFVQRFGIKSTTTTPEAHWQSGKIERHGSFLQTMLDKIDMEHPIQDYHAL